MDVQLLPNISVDYGTDSFFPDQELSFAQMYDKFMLLNIIKRLQKINFIPLHLLKILKAECKKIKRPCEFSKLLRDWFLALRQPAESSVTTQKSRSLAAEKADANTLITKNKNLEKDLQAWKRKIKLLQAKFNKKEDELKIANKKLEASNADLKKELEKLSEELAIVQEKYINMEKLSKEKNADMKKNLVMYLRLVKYQKEQSASACEDCGKLRKKVKELNTICENSESQITRLKFCNKDLEKKEEQSRCEVEALQKQIQELKQKLFIEKSAMSKNAADRFAATFHYFSNLYEPPTKEDSDTKKEAKKERIVKNYDHYSRGRKKAYDEPSTSNSMLASHSIRKSFFQTADEDDFLNESSLTEIHNEITREDGCGESHLQEIRRRNTLCPPQLQSSYPVKIQDMTPSDEKYYVPEESSFTLGPKSSLYQGPRKKLNSEYVESDAESLDGSHSFPVKKRKVAKTDSIYVSISKKPCRPSSSIVKAEPSTPLKRVTAYVKKRATFRTPSSVQRLMSMHRKNKAH